MLIKGRDSYFWHKEPLFACPTPYLPFTTTTLSSHKCYRNHHKTPFNPLPLTPYPFPLSRFENDGGFVWLNLTCSVAEETQRKDLIHYGFAPPFPAKNVCKDIVSSIPKGWKRMKKKKREKTGKHLHKTRQCETDGKTEPQHTKEIEQ